VDAFLGTTGFPAIAEVLDRLRAGEKSISYFPDVNLLTEESPRRITNRPYTEYLKIAEGCDKKCTYCAIPHFRGSYRSVPMNRLVKTARELVNDGVRELILVAQETTVYGVDLYGEKKLPELLHRLAEIEDLAWIRILYCYPEEIDDALIEAIATEPKVLHYIDMPLQHTEDRVLQRMGRRLTKKGLFSLVDRLRTRIPDITLRTTLITGFPGETEEEHAAVLETLDTLEFDRVGVFTYSREEGTIAADMPDQIPEETRQRYRDEIMELQQEISLDKNVALVGSRMAVMIEGYMPEDDVYVARSYRDAPDVDGMVFLSSDRELISGTILPALITGAAEYDLTAEIAE
jgi:ribosomal protein S12 methylthiotransferase